MIKNIIFTHGLWSPSQCWPGTCFTSDFLLAIQIRWKFRLDVIPFLALRVQQIFAHATTAVPCTKFGSDHFVRIMVRLKRNFYQIWIPGEKTLVKRGPEPVWSKFYHTTWRHYYEIQQLWLEHMKSDRPWISPWIKSISNEWDISLSTCLCHNCRVP